MQCCTVAASLCAFPAPRISAYRPFSYQIQSLVPAKALRGSNKLKLKPLAPLTTASDPNRFSWKIKSALDELPIEKDLPRHEGKIKVKVFKDEEGVSIGLAKYTAHLSEKFVREKGSFTVVLSGGTLIDTVRKLVQSPFKESVDWAKWHIVWVDERAVPKEDEDSNYKLAYNGFLSKVPIPPHQIYAINDSRSPFYPEAAAVDYETCLRELVKKKVVELGPNGFPRFDLMLLGMGPCGHVASLFPWHPQLNEHQRWVTFIKNSPKPPPERITFTFPVINTAKEIFMVVTGAELADTVHKALEPDEFSDTLPVQMVKPKVGELVWFLDKDAASKLKSIRVF